MKFERYYIAIPVIACIAILASAFYFTPYFEIMKPEIKPLTSIGPIGIQKTLSVEFADRRSGLRHIDISISQDSKTYRLATLDFPERGTTEKTLTLEVNPRNLRLHDGEATVTATAVDHSLFGNTARLVEKVTLDTVPPQVSLFSTVHNIRPGGTCLVVYRVSKDTDKNGIQIGDDFFPGYAVTLGGKPTYLAYVPIPLVLDQKTFRMLLAVRDKGGNAVSIDVPRHIQPQKFRKDTLEITDRFLAQKMPEFQQLEPSLRGKTPLETFRDVNEKMREENFKTIQSFCSATSGTPLWKGPFVRMKNAAPMAMFGDMRTYTYERKRIGGSTHLGVDLASTAHAPIEAANDGIVLYAGYLGIYGNTVILDHGLGVSSLYAHLNEIKVKAGQRVAKEEVIGLSGSSGLAGGDHLHFSILVGGRFVNPVEWWDPHWIQDNIDAKIGIAS